MHQRNIHSLAIEMFKVKNGIGPILLNEIFIERQYNGPTLRSKTDFVKPTINTEHFGKGSLKYFGSVIWDLIPNSIKYVDHLQDFKILIKAWSPDECPCRLCKVFFCSWYWLHLRLH